MFSYLHDRDERGLADTILEGKEGANQLAVSVLKASVLWSIRSQAATKLSTLNNFLTIAPRGWSGSMALLSLILEIPQLWPLLLGSLHVLFSPCFLCLYDASVGSRGLQCLYSRRWLPQLEDEGSHPKLSNTPHVSVTMSRLAGRTMERGHGHMAGVLEGKPNKDRPDTTRQASSETAWNYATHDGRYSHRHISTPSALGTSFARMRNYTLNITIEAVPESRVCAWQKRNLCALALSLLY